MLYASTRSKVETYTAQRTLWQERADDGGFFVPLKLPVFRRTEIIKMRNRTPEDNLAMILNKFFQTELSGKELQFAIGSGYYRLVPLRQKVILGELWHNPDGELDQIVHALTRRLAVEQQDGAPGEWPRTAVRIALLFALFGELMDGGEVNPLNPMDLSVPAGDFTWPMAAWYARRMGLPIGTIICSTCGIDGVRDLLHRGQIRLEGTPKTSIAPRYDITIPVGIERMIYEILGAEEAQEFVRRMEAGGTYAVNPEQRRLLAEDMYVAVNNSVRLSAVIPNAWRTFQHVLCPYGAMVYTGMMDYQSVTGKYNKVLMLCDYSPVHSLDITARAMGIRGDELRNRLNLK